MVLIVYYLICILFLIEFLIHEYFLTLGVMALLSLCIKKENVGNVENNRGIT